MDNANIPNALLVWHRSELAKPKRNPWLILIVVVIFGGGIALSFFQSKWGVAALVFALIMLVILPLISSHTDTTFAILPTGIRANSELFTFNDMEGFAIWDTVPPILVFKRANNSTIPVPIRKEDIEIVHKLVRQYLPEVDAKPSMAYLISQNLGIY